MKKENKILIPIIALCFIGSCFVIYFASQISATLDPLKEYTFSITKEKSKNPMQNLHLYASNISCKINDSTGTEINGFKYYSTIQYSNRNTKYEYHVNYEINNNFWKQEPSLKLNLTAAFNKSKNTGGYQIQDKDVSQLIQTFEKNILPKIKK